MRRNFNFTAFLLTLVIFWGGVFVYAQDIELEQEVFKIARQVRCPVCRAESAADSNATTSIEFRNIIQEQLVAGKNEAEILSFFQERYGDWILLEPSKTGLSKCLQEIVLLPKTLVNLLLRKQTDVVCLRSAKAVWLLSLIALLIALLVFVIVIRRWLKKAQQTIEVSTEDLERVRQMLKTTNGN